VNKARQEIDYNYNDWQKIVENRTFKKTFPEGLDKSEILSRPPKGYDEENPAIETLKLKSFTVSRPIAETTLTSRTLVKEVTNPSSGMKELIYFLNRSLE